MSRTRTLLNVFAAGLVCALPAGIAHAQSYPFKTIEWISHSSAGSGTDLFNRNVSGGIL